MQVRYQTAPRPVSHQYRGSIRKTAPDDTPMRPLGRQGAAPQAAKANSVFAKAKKRGEKL